LFTELAQASVSPPPSKKHLVSLSIPIKLYATLHHNVNTDKPRVAAELRKLTDGQVIKKQKCESQ